MFVYDQWDEMSGTGSRHRRCFVGISCRKEADLKKVRHITG
jgi:hypothetical protein